MKTKPNTVEAEIKCFKHWFVNKATVGVPGTAWQECEMCGRKLEEILATHQNTLLQELLKEAVRVEYSVFADRRRVYKAVPIETIKARIKQ